MPRLKRDSKRLLPQSSISAFMEMLTGQPTGERRCAEEGEVFTGPTRLPVFATEEDARWWWRHYRDRLEAKATERSMTCWATAYFVHGDEGDSPLPALWATRGSKHAQQSDDLLPRV